MIIWAIANLIVSYLPHVPFQRKLLQGEHFPLAILAGIGAAWALHRISSRSTERQFNLAAIALTALLSISNLEFMYLDAADYSSDRVQTQTHRPYMQPGEVKALDWIAANAPADAAIQPLPWIRLVAAESGRSQVSKFDMTLACFAPALTQRHVYCGHWGETPDYERKLSELTTLLLPQKADTSDAAQLTLLGKMRVRYLVFSQTQASDAIASVIGGPGQEIDSLIPVLRNRVPLPDYLKIRYENAEAVVYEVLLPNQPAIGR